MEKSNKKKMEAIITSIESIEDDKLQDIIGKINEDLYEYIMENNLSLGDSLVVMSVVTAMFLDKVARFVEEPPVEVASKFTEGLKRWFSQKD